MRWRRGGGSEGVDLLETNFALQTPIDRMMRCDSAASDGTEQYLSDRINVCLLHSLALVRHVHLRGYER